MIIPDILLTIAIATTIYSLIRASALDYKSRIIPIKTWALSAYIGIPCAFLGLLLNILNGDFSLGVLPYIIGSVLIINIITIIAASITIKDKHIFGGADSIAINICLLTTFYYRYGTFIPTFLENLLIFCIVAAFAGFILHRQNIRDYLNHYKFAFIIPITCAYITSLFCNIIQLKLFF